MDQPFDLNAFLHCPQGPQMEDNARDDACRMLKHAVEQGLVVTAAQLLMQDPSLITANLDEEPLCFTTAAELANDCGLDSFVLFALAHGIRVTSPIFGNPSGLLEAAVHQNSPGLVSYALLYQADPNQITTGDKRSMLEVVITTICSTAPPRNLSEFVKALQIAHMLLDAGADPMLPGRANNTIYALCVTPWGRNEEFNRLFTEVIKRTGKIRKRRIGDPSTVLLAAQAGNLDAAKQLIAAGVWVNPHILYVTLDTTGKSKDIPAFVALLGGQVRSQSGAPAYTSSTAVERNLAPKGFLQLPPGQRLSGSARADACRLLDMAITQGRFITATKILSMDPSLITESVGQDGFPKLPAIQKAIAAGMTALVPFALTHGVTVGDPAFGAPGGLLDKACSEQAGALASYALLYDVDPNLSGPPSLLIKAFDNVLIPGDSKALEEWLPLAKMLLGAGASLSCAEERETMLDVLSTKDTSSWESDLDDVLAMIVNREGRAHADLLADGRPILSLAAEKGRIKTVKALITAGANTDPDFLGADLFSLIKAGDGEQHLPVLADLLMQQQIAKGPSGALAPSVILAEVAEARTHKPTSRDVF